MSEIAIELGTRKAIEPGFYHTLKHVLKGHFSSRGIPTAYEIDKAKNRLIVRGAPQDRLSQIVAKSMHVLNNNVEYRIVDLQA